MDQALAAAPAPQGSPDTVDTSSFNAGLMVLLLVLWSSVGHMAVSRTKYLGEGSCACALGLIAGALLLLLRRVTGIHEEALRQLLTFNPADFFTYFLPPIIFYAGLSVKKKKFFQNFGSIALLGIVGTWILFSIIAFCLFAISKLPNLLNFTDCLALGAIFAATDTVAVLQVIRPEASGVLYSLVFGEGVMNDATSVALLRVIQLYSQHTGGSGSGSALTGIVGVFVYLFLASLALGSAFGLGIAFLLKALRSRDSPQEVAVIGMLAYLSYLCAELLGISGIVSLFCCGVVTSHYVLHNVSSLTRATTLSAFQTLSYISEGCIFIYVGLDTLDPITWKNTYFSELVWLGVTLLVLLIVGRALYVIPFALLHNAFSSEQLSASDVVIIWWGGLMRGAVSTALIYRYFDPHGGGALDGHRSTLITTTLLVVLLSTMVMGAFTKPLLDYIQGPAGEPLSHMMELIPHSLRSRGRGDLTPRGGRGEIYAAMDIPNSNRKSRRMPSARLLERSNTRAHHERAHSGLTQMRRDISFGEVSDFSLTEGESPMAGVSSSPRMFLGTSATRGGLARWWDGDGEGGGGRGAGKHGDIPPYGTAPRDDVYRSPSHVEHVTGVTQDPGHQGHKHPGTSQSVLQGGGVGSSDQPLSFEASPATGYPARGGNSSDVEQGFYFGRLDSDPAPSAFDSHPGVPIDPTAGRTAVSDRLGPTDNSEGPGMASPSTPPNPERLLSMESPSALSTLWRTFDAQYMQPIFGGPGSIERRRPPERSGAELADGPRRV